jgi:hypothetical protein
MPLMLPKSCTVVRMKINKNLFTSVSLKELSSENQHGSKVTQYQSKAYDLGLARLGFILHFKGPRTSKLKKKRFQRLNNFLCGVIRKCGVRYKITL